MSKTNLFFSKEKHGGGINQELGINIHTPLYIRQIIDKDQLNSTENFAHYSVKNYMRKES